MVAFHQVDRLFAVALVVLSVTRLHAETGNLVVRVLDDLTGKPIPSRLVIHTSDDKYHLDRLGASVQQWPNIESHATFMDQWPA